MVPFCTAGGSRNASCRQQLQHLPPLGVSQDSVQRRSRILRTRATARNEDLGRASSSSCVRADCFSADEHQRAAEAEEEAPHQRAVEAEDEHQRAAEEEEEEEEEWEEEEDEEEEDEEEDSYTEGRAILPG